MKLNISSKLVQVLCVIIFIFENTSIFNVLPLVSYIQNYFKCVINEMISLYIMSSFTSSFLLTHYYLRSIIHLISSKIPIQDDKKMIAKIYLAMSKSETSTNPIKSYFCVRNLPGTKVSHLPMIASTFDTVWKCSEKNVKSELYYQN